MASPLFIVPTYLSSEDDAEVTLTTVDTLFKHEPDADLMIVDDCSPDEDSLDFFLERLHPRVSRVELKDENEGFSRTVNVGLRTALSERLDAVLVNADIEFVCPVVETFRRTTDSKERPAAVVGALLLYPTGMIQHAGIYFSFLSRAFDHWYRYGPGALPEAQFPRVCPVTGALQFIRHETLEAVGLYDEDFRMGFEDVDYCLRVFDEGLECVYEPAVKAVHHESLFRGTRSERLDEWHGESIKLLYSKHGQTSLGRYVPRIT